ncbi:MAG: IscA/HesB family protein [Desulfovibrionaceae bacterium]|nr:IscA/HesB family protein [Desulfovibrionaceae bacterium]
MLELSDSARKELDAFFISKPEEQKSIRIYSVNACHGPMLQIALDNAAENDVVEKNGDYSFCIDKDLLAQVKSVKIDLTYMGFVVDPEQPLPVTEGGGCGSCCGGCH